MQNLDTKGNHLLSLVNERTSKELFLSATFANIIRDLNDEDLDFLYEKTKRYDSERKELVRSILKDIFVLGE